MHDLIPLNMLAPGESGNISQVMGQAELVHRLEELGLRGGATVEMVQSGSPCIIRLAGQKLCLRADELLSVLVERGSRELMLLQELAIGTRGRVLSIKGTDELSMRLLEMGLTPGVEVSVVGAAPLGDPLELELRGYRLSVRKSEAARVEVDRLD